MRAGGAKRGCVGAVQFAESVDGHVVEKGCGVGVDAFGGFGAAGADQLSAEEFAGLLVAGRQGYFRRPHRSGVVSNLRAACSGVLSREKPWALPSC
jgi:hypothetical protein